MAMTISDSPHTHDMLCRTGNAACDVDFRLYRSARLTDPDVQNRSIPDPQPRGKLPPPVELVVQPIDNIKIFRSAYASTGYDNIRICERHHFGYFATSRICVIISGRIGLRRNGDDLTLRSGHVVVTWDAQAILFSSAKTIYRGNARCSSAEPSSK